MDKKKGILLLASLPVLVSAKSVTYNDGVRLANNYIERFTDYNKYINVINDGEFKNGQFISKNEFDLTNMNRNSWLATGIQYWTLTDSGNGTKYIIDNTIKPYSMLNTSGVRVTEYVRKETKVTGSGTLNNPWEFVDQYEVAMWSDNPKLGKILDEVKIVAKDSNSDVIFDYETAPGYKLDKIDCNFANDIVIDNNIDNKNITNGIIVIDKNDIKNDIRCKVSFAARNDINYTIKLHKQNANDNNETVESIVRQGTTDKTESISFPAPDGFTTNGTSTKDLTIKGDGTSVVDFYYNRKQFEIKLVAGTGISSVSGAGTYKYEQKVAINASVSSGYTWSKWSGISASTANTEIIVPLGGATYTASAKANTYSVKLDGQGATSAGTTSINATYDANMPSITAPLKNYVVSFNSTGGSNVNALTSVYAFGGYYTAINGGGSQYYNGNASGVSKWKETAPVTLYAKWTSKSIILPSVNKSGYTFNGWYTEASGGTKVGGNGESYTPKSNITLYAHWTQNTPPPSPRYPPSTPSTPSTPSKPSTPSSGSSTCTSNCYTVTDSKGNTSTVYIKPGNEEKVLTSAGVGGTITCASSSCNVSSGKLSAASSSGARYDYENSDGSKTSVSHHITGSYVTTTPAGGGHSTTCKVGTCGC